MGTVNRIPLEPESNLTILHTTTYPRLRCQDLLREDAINDEARYLFDDQIYFVSESSLYNIVNKVFGPLPKLAWIEDDFYCPESRWVHPLRELLRSIYTIENFLDTNAKHKPVRFINYPEHHLSGFYQLKLMEYLGFLCNDVRLVLLTQSEMIVNGARLLVKDGVLDKNSVKIHHINLENKTVIDMCVDKDGKLSSWPESMCAWDYIVGRLLSS